jgi:hypothetical protein
MIRFKHWRMTCLVELDHELSADDCSAKANIKLALAALVLFALQQLLEFCVLSSIQTTYLEMCRWDCDWYSSIIDRGYDRYSSDTIESKNFAFFPLLPIIAAALQWLIGVSTKAALIIVGKIFFLLAIFAFMKFCKKYFPEIYFITAGAVVAFNPYAIYPNSGYTESLFLFFTCVSFYFMKQRKNFSCGACGIFLSATRLVGVVMAVSYAISNFKDFFKAAPWQKVKIALAGLMLVSGLALFMTYLHFHSGDAFAFFHAGKAWDREVSNPFANLIDGFNSELPFYQMASVVSVGAILCCVYLLAKKHFQLAAFSLFCTFIPLSTGLWSMPRYIWFQAPILLVIAKMINGGSAGLVFFISIPVMYFLYCVWLSGYHFIV